MWDPPPAGQRTPIRPTVGRSSGTSWPCRRPTPYFHTRLAPGDHEAELGFWLGVPYWGRGIIPEAAEEVLRHAFEDLEMQRVWCAYYDGNEKSRRAQEKLGFRYEKTTEDENVPHLGEKRRHHANLLTIEAWEARRARQSSSQQRS